MKGMVSPNHEGDSRAHSDSGPENAGISVAVSAKRTWSAPRLRRTPIQSVTAGIGGGGSDGTGTHS